MFTDDTTFVIGVDTHRDTHAFAVVDRATGAVVDEFECPAAEANVVHLPVPGTSGEWWCHQMVGG